MQVPVKPKMLSSCLKIIGGKRKLREKLYSMFPKDIETFYEPFAGSLAVLIGHEPWNREYVSDTNPFSMGFFRVLQTQPEAFWGLYEIERLKLSKEYFEKCKQDLTELQNHRDSDYRQLRLALSYYFVNKLCMNGIVRFNSKGICNSSYCGQTTGRGLFTRAWFDQIVTRIKDVSFNNVDYRVLLRHANHVEKPNAFVKAALGRDLPGPETRFIMADPPYTGPGVYTEYWSSRFKEPEQEQLAELLAKSKARWLLTINDCEFIRGLYAGFNIHEHEVGYSCSQSSKGRGNHKELIITNFG